MNVGRQTLLAGRVALHEQKGGDGDPWLAPLKCGHYLLVNGWINYFVCVHVTHIPFTAKSSHQTKLFSFPRNTCNFKGGKGTRPCILHGIGFASFAVVVSRERRGKVVESYCFRYCT